MVRPALSTLGVGALLFAIYKMSRPAPPLPPMLRGPVPRVPIRLFDGLDFEAVRLRRG